MTDIANTTSHHLTHTTTPVTATAQQRTSSMTSAPLSRTPAVTNPSTRSNTSRIKSTSQLPTSKPAEDDTKISLHNNETPGNEETTAGESDERPQTGLLAGIVMVMVIMGAAVLLSVYMYNHPTSSASLFFMERRPTRWPIMKFRRGSGCPSYAEVEAPGQDRDGTAVIDPKQSFVMSDRRESEQKEGFIVPDQRERFLVSESS